MFVSREIPIFVNVYDLHQSNGVLHSVGAGFYHTGVEVSGYEYSFSESGVVRTQPRLPAFGEFREQLTMGYYTGGMGGINSVISELRNAQFQPGAYHPVHLNCNHFSEAFCQRTVQASLPEYVNRLANVGSNLVRKPAPKANNDEALAAPGQVKAPELKTSSTSSSSSRTAGNNKGSYAIDTADGSNSSSSGSSSSSGGVSSIFSWLGWGTSTSGSAAASTGDPSATAANSSKPQQSATNTKKTDPKKKKELTEKQKELLSKMKQKS